MKNTKRLSLLLSVALFLSACGQAKEKVLEVALDTVTVEQIIEEIPELGPVFEADPDLAERYIAEIKVGMVAGGGDISPAAMDRARAVLTKDLTRKVVLVATPLQKDYLSLTADTFRAIQKNKPSICKAMFMGQPIGDMSSAVGTELANRELAVMATILSADDVPGASGDAARGAKLVGKEMQSILKKLDIDFTQPGAAAGLDASVACDLIIQLTESRLRLPPQDLRDTLATDRDAAAG